jgi:hypothetical protein
LKIYFQIFYLVFKPPRTWHTLRAAAGDVVRYLLVRWLLPVMLLLCLLLLLLCLLLLLLLMLL